jgi:putative DNA primase/helicase
MAAGWRWPEQEQAAPDHDDPGAENTRGQNPQPSEQTDEAMRAPPHASQADLMLRFIQAHGDRTRYVAGWDRWRLWDGTVWREDATLKINDMALAVCCDAAAACNKSREAKALASAAAVGATLALAKAHRAVAATVEQWDRDQWLLNTPGCTINLSTGTRRPHDRLDYITKVTAVAPVGDCPRWHQFITEITGGDEELGRFLQRMAGYALTGCTHEHALFFLYGTGANGKGVFLNTLTGILNDYAVVAPMAAFIASQQDRHTTDLAMMRGARLVVAQETESGRYWNESLVKSLTGGDRITARFMRQDNFTFDPQFTLIIGGNHRPSLRNVTYAIRRRFFMIPFTVTFPDNGTDAATQRDKNLAAKLRAEWPGILGWMTEGCADWRANGLRPPRCVVEATSTYLANEADVARWIEECCILDQSLWTASGQLYASWKTWAEEAGEPGGSQKRLVELLENHASPKREAGTGRRGFSGIGLKPPTTQRWQPG